MFELTVSLIVGLFLFACTIAAYCMGLQHGKEISKGNAPRIELNPAKPILKAVEKHKEEKKVDELKEELTDIMSYTRESALNAVKKERWGGVKHG